MLLNLSAAKDLRATADFMLKEINIKGLTAERAALLDMLFVMHDAKASAQQAEQRGRNDPQRKAVLGYLARNDQAPELKALEAQRDDRGGYLLGEQLLEEYIAAQAQASAMRRLARSFTLARGYDGAAAPRQDSRMTDAQWTTELGAGLADAIDMFGRRSFKPAPLAKYALASKALLRKGGAFAEQIIIDALAEAVAVPSEYAFLNGVGTGQPLGLLKTPSIPSTTTSGASALTIADVKRWIGGLGGRHHKSATALMHVDTYSAMLQLDTAGALSSGGQLLGRYPVEFSDQFPSGGTNPAALASGTTIAIIGDFSRYWIVDSLETSIERLRELHAETGQDAFMVRAELDAQAVDAGAFNMLAVQ